MFVLERCQSLSLTNGRVNYDRQKHNDGKYPINTIATLICNTGFIIDSSRTCQPSANWNGQTTTCKRSNLNITDYFHSLLICCLLISWSLKNSIEPWPI